MDAADIPTKSDLLRTGLLKRFPDPKHELSAEEVNAIVAAILALRGAGSQTDAIEVVDDFHDLSAWAVSLKAGADVEVGASLTAIGFPSSGVAALNVTATASSEVSLSRAQTGFVLGPSSPIVIEWRVAGAMNSGVLSDTQCAWLLGIVDTSGQNGVVLEAYLTGGNRAFRLSTIIGMITAHEAITMPAVSAYFSVRLTISETGTKVEVAPDGAPYATVLAGSSAPAHQVYAPYADLSKDTGSGDRTLFLDQVRIVGSRAAADSGSFVDDFVKPSPLYVPATPANWGGGGPPKTHGEATDRIAAAVVGLLGHSIP